MFFVVQREILMGHPATFVQLRSLARFLRERLDASPNARLFVVEWNASAGDEAACELTYALLREVDITALSPQHLILEWAVGRELGALVCCLSEAKPKVRVLICPPEVCEARYADFKDVTSMAEYAYLTYSP